MATKIKYVPTLKGESAKKFNVQAKEALKNKGSVDFSKEKADARKILCSHQYVNAGTLQGSPMKRCLGCGKYIKS